MATYYDPKTDRIVGARRGTWAYAHELRHRWQFKRFPRLEDTITRVHLYCYHGSIIAGIVLGVLFGLAGVIAGVGMGMMAHVALNAALELDAYLVGTYYWLRGRDA